MGLGVIQSKNNYEDLRNARILENQNRLKTLGLQKTISELQSLVSPQKPWKTTPVKKWTKKVYQLSSLRRSDRLKKTPLTPEATTIDNGSSKRRSHRLRTKLFEPISDIGKENGDEESCSRDVGEEIVRPANMPLVKIVGLESRLSPEALSRRCGRNGRGSVYDSIFGICCHFCRQKTLCSEEDCKRCGNLDTEEPCIGKTDCTACHSTNGVLCRACLKIRYGEELEDVIGNKDWMCPHCIEEKGTKAYWMCNSSICLKKKKIAPTGIAIYRAQESGYKSVAHLLMDELQGAAKRKRC